MLNPQEKNMAAEVARAAPATSMPKPATIVTSSAMFTTHDTSRKASEAVLFPIPRRMPAFML